jgi:hypothetical protein
LLRSVISTNKDYGSSHFVLLPEVSTEALATLKTWRFWLQRFLHYI